MSWGPLERGERLETPERVDLSVDLAGVGSRGLACLADTMLCLIALLAISVSLYVSSIFVGRWLLAMLLVGIFLIQWFYYAAFEALGDGQTPGKRLVGLRVQRVGGYPIGWSEAIIRNFLRVIDSFLVYSVGIVVMLLTPRSQRIGDLAAGTVVVRERTWGRTELERIGYGDGGAVAPGPDAQPEENASVRRLEISGHELELVHDFLRRREGLSSDARARIASAMASLFRRRLGERGALPDAWSGLESEAFLQALDAALRGAASAPPGA